MAPFRVPSPTESAQECVAICVGMWVNALICRWTGVPDDKNKKKEWVFSKYSYTCSQLI